MTEFGADAQYILVKALSGEAFRVTHSTQSVLKMNRQYVPRL
jgi:hypothetical protein